jgi:outer membrane immunogenic protein
MEVATNLKQSMAALAAAAAGSSGAMAADLAVKAPPPPPPLAPAATWQGFYVGGSVGASWLHSTFDDTAAIGDVTTSNAIFPLNSTTGGSSVSANGVGFLAGLHLGYNLQSGNFVYGLEGGFSWLGSTSASSNGAFVHQSGYPSVYAGTRTRNGTTTSSSKVSELATLRARFGLDFNGTLPYLTAGVAWGHIETSFTITGAGYSSPIPATATATQKSWVPGVVLGGGIEHKLTQNWTVRGEIMWVGFKDMSVGNPIFSNTYSSLTSNGVPVKFSNELTIGEIGLNYRF